ncbi:MAG: alpha/beta hydrolase [Oligoflexia bacterium]|nr:alpha/beta hydrolase [Oligoflexia bacterium]
MLKGQIRYQLICDEQELTPSKKNIIIFVHGQSEYLEKYQFIVNKLNTLNSDFFFFDLRGHGKSADRLTRPNRTHIESFDQYVYDLDNIVKMLKEKKYKNIFIISHSAGGLVSALYLEKNPLAIRAAVLSSPMIEINTKPYPKIMAQAMAQTACIVGLGKHVIDNTGGFPAEKLTHDIDFWNSNQIGYELFFGGRPTYGWVRAGFIGIDSALKNIKKIKIPLLVFGAGLDQVVHTSGTEDFVEKLRAENGNDSVNYIRYEGKKHELLMETNRIEVLKEIEKFFLKFI